MKCPICHCSDYRATHTYSNIKVKYKGKTIIITKRRRMCRNCKHVGSTTERHREDDDNELEEIR